MPKALFLDRDGVINEDFGYVHKKEDIVFCPHIFTLCRRFVKQHYQLIIVTNQSGIGRKMYDHKDFSTLCDFIKKTFSDQGIPIRATYYCPHLPNAHCNCRKPKPGMILQAAQAHHIQLADSVLIGDKKTDMQAGEQAGIKKLWWYNGDASQNQYPVCTDLSAIYPSNEKASSIAEHTT